MINITKVMELQSFPVKQEKARFGGFLTVFGDLSCLLALEIEESAQECTIIGAYYGLKIFKINEHIGKSNSWTNNNK